MSEPTHISEIKMQEHLREAYSQDREVNFLSQILRRLADPTRATSDKDMPRLNPLCLQIGMLVLFALFVFLYFTFGRP